MPVLIFALISAILGAVVATCILTLNTLPEPKEKKIIIKTANEVASLLLEAIESPSTTSISEEDKAHLFYLLVKSLMDDNHPDTQTFHYIGDKIVSKEEDNVVWLTWFIISLRRLSRSFNESLPEAWFLYSHRNEPPSPIAPHPSEADDLIPELDLSQSSDIFNDVSDSEDSQQLITEAGPLVSPQLNEPAEITSEYLAAMD